MKTTKSELEIKALEVYIEATQLYIKSFGAAEAFDSNPGQPPPPPPPPPGH